MVRRMGQKVDPLSGELFTHMVYDPPPASLEGEKEKESEEDGDEEEDGEEEEEKEKKERDEFAEDLVIKCIRYVRITASTRVTSLHNQYLYTCTCACTCTCISMYAFIRYMYNMYNVPTGGAGQPPTPSNSDDWSFGKETRRQ